MADIIELTFLADTKPLDKIISKTNRIEKEIRDLAVAYQKGRITLAQYDKQVSRLASSFQSAAGGTIQARNSINNYSKTVFQAAKAQGDLIRRTDGATGALLAQASATQQTRRGTNQLGVLMQQTGYQVGDFAVQVQSGTNVMVALGQQATQLVGTFGMLSKSTKMIGVFAGLGIAIPILTAVAGAFMRMREEAEGAGTTLEKLETTVDKLKSSQDLLSMSTAELSEKYGDAAESIREYAKVEAALNIAVGKSQLKESIANLSELVTTYTTLQDAGRNYQNTIDRIEKDFGVLNGEAKLLEASFTALATAQTFEHQNAAVDDLIGNMRVLGISLSDLPGPVAEMLLEFIKANRTVEEAEAIITSLEGSLSGLANEAATIGPALQSAIDQANAFASALGRAANNAASIGISTAGMRAERKALEKGMSQAEATAIAEATTAREKILSTVDRPGPQRDILAQEEFERTRQAVLERELEKSRLGKVKESLQPDTGGVGDGSAIDERQKMIDSVNRLISSYDEEYAKALKVEEATRLIAEAQRMGAIPANMEADQVLQDYIKSLEDAKDPMADFVNNFAKQMSSAFMSIVDGSKSASDAFRDMARAILKQAFEMAVINPIINSIFGGVGGFTKLPSFFANGAAFSNGKVTAFADGGVVNGPTVFPMANGMGLMGEAGPEAVMPLKRGKNGKLGVQVEGNQQPVVINQSFNFSANGDESVKRIIAQEAPRIANLTQKQILDQRRRGGTFKSTFG